MFGNLYSTVPFGVLLLMWALQVGAAGESAATIATLKGKAFVIGAERQIERRRLQQGDVLYAGDRIITGRDAQLTLAFTDETRVILSEQTIFKIDAYQYRKEAARDAQDSADESMSFSILGGAVRALTGLLAKRKPAMIRFATTVATIGIRGTHFAAEVSATSALVVLLEQEDILAANAIEVSNQYGKVEIDEPGYGTEVPDATSPPSPPRKMELQSMNRLLRGVQTNRRVIVPRMQTP